MAVAGSLIFNFKSSGLDQLRNQLNGAGNAAGATRAQMMALAKATAAVTAAGVAMGVGIKKLADASGGFSFELARAGAITKATADDLAILEKAAINAGIATQFSPREAAEGLAVLGSQGLSAAQAAGVLTPVLDLAAAGLISVQDAASSVVGVLGAYGKSVGEAASVTDKLVTITNISGYQATEFSQSLGKAASKTATANQSFETTLVTMGLLRNIATDASSAGVYYAKAVQNMATKQRAFNAMQKVGVDFYEKGTRKTRQLTDVVFDLEKAIGGLNEEEQNKIKTDIFGGRAIGIYNAITKASITTMRDGEKVTLKGAEAVEEYRRRLDTAGGAAAEFTERLLKTYEGQKTLLSGTLETLAIVVGKPFESMLAPIVKAVVDSLNQLIQLINRVPERTKKIGAAAAIGFAGLLTAAGAVGSAILAIGVAAQFVAPAMAAGLAAVPAVLGTITAAAMKVAVVLLPLIVILGTIGLVVGLLYEANERTLGGVTDLWESFAQFVRDVGSYINEQFQNIAEYVTGVWNRATNALSEWWNSTMSGISEATSGMVAAVGEMLDKFVNFIVRKIGGLVDTYGELLFALGYEQEAAGLRQTIKDLKEFDQGVAGIAKAIDKKFLQPAKKAMISFGDSTLDTLANIGQFGADVASDLGNSFKDGFGMALTGAKKLLSKGLNEVSSALPDLGKIEVPGAAKGPGGTLPGAGGGGGLTDDYAKRMRAQHQQQVQARRAQRAQETQDRQMGAISAAQGVAGGNVGQIASGIAAAMGSALGPVGSAAVGLADQLIGASVEGAKFKKDLSGIFTTLAQALNPLFKALRPVLELFQVLAELVGMFIEIAMATSLLQPALYIIAQLFRSVALIIKNLMIGLRAFYLSILGLIDAIPGVDMSRQIREVERAQAREVRERNELIERMRGEATLDEQRARRERELARATREATSAMLNVPSGYKVARAGFGAEAPVMDDFIYRPGQSAVAFSPNDTVIGVKDLADLGGGQTIVIQNVNVAANNPTSFFRQLMETVNRDTAAGGVSLGGAFQGRL